MSTYTCHKHCYHYNQKCRYFFHLLHLFSVKSITQLIILIVIAFPKALSRDTDNAIGNAITQGDNRPVSLHCFIYRIYYNSIFIKQQELLQELLSFQEQQFLQELLLFQEQQFLRELLFLPVLL